MQTPPPHRKRVRHFDDVGEFHELTFSCFHQLPLLTDEKLLVEVSRAIDRAAQRHHWRLSAFVFMPEHVHLIVYPTKSPAPVADLLFAIKRPFSYRAKLYFKENRSDWLEKLMVRQRPGVQTFRFWQEGPGYDRNLRSEKALRAVIDYLHLNPVRRGLVDRDVDYRWSSAAWYQSDGRIVDLLLPTLSSPPADFFAGRSDFTS
ncbi:MAG: hypothetical protein WD851_03625 [Pirellulales bacterium]